MTFKLKKKPQFKFKSKPSERRKSPDAGTGDTKPPIKIERAVLHLEKKTSCYRVRYIDIDGKKQHMDIPRKDFKMPKDVVKLLMDGHAALPKDAESQAVTDALEHMSNRGTLRLTGRVGWHGVPSKGGSFVDYAKTYGPDDGTLEYDRDGLTNAALGQKEGSLAAWRDGLREPCLHSDELVLAVSIGSSGPLYGIVPDQEPGIFCFEGARIPPGETGNFKSTSGKTLDARAGQSMSGRAGRTDLFSFNMTRNGVEETCYACNHHLLVLDEEGTAGESGDGTILSPAKIAYMVVGGQGKVRAQSYAKTHGLSNRAWALPVITTSEDELDSGKKVRKEGERVRALPIPFAPTKDGGTFHMVPVASKRTKLAQAVETTIAANYGVAMPAYLDRLTSHCPTAEEIREIRDEFVADVGAAGDSWERRYAEKFGFVLAGAVLLARYEIAPFTEGRAKEALLAVYKASRSLTVSVPQATDAVLVRLRTAMTSKKRFPRLAKGETLDDARKKAAWGVKRDIGNKKNVVVVRATRFEKLVVPSAASNQVLEELAARGLLLKDPDGNKKRQLSIKGLTDKRVRYVCIKGLVAKRG